MIKSLNRIAHDLVNDEVFLNNSVDKIIGVIKDLYVFNDINMIELTKLMNIEQRKLKLKKINKSINK